MHISIYDDIETIGEPMFDVYLDGRKIENVIEANEEEGFIVRFKGGNVYEHLNSPSLATERLEGVVELVRIENEE